MTALLSNVQKLQKKSAEIIEKTSQMMREEVVVIAVREYLGSTTEDDVESLSAYLVSIPMSEKEYLDMVSTIGRVVTAQASHERDQENGSERSEAAQHAQAKFYEATHVANFWSRRWHHLKENSSHEVSKSIREAKAKTPLLFDDSGEPVEHLRALIDGHKQRKVEDEKQWDEQNAARLQDDVDTHLAKFSLKLPKTTMKVR